MKKNESTFLFYNQSAADMISALHVTANNIERSPGSKPNNYFPFYPYVTPATLHSNQHNRPQVSTNSPKIAPTSVATPFGINDILSRTEAKRVFAGNFPENRAIDDYKLNQAPNTAGTMATVGSNVESKISAGAVAAHAAAMLFNNHHGISCHDNQLGQLKFSGKPLTDLPGRPPIHWPGVLTEDWQEKVGIHGL